MGLTIAEKILGAEAGRVVVAKIDFAMIHDARAAGMLAAVERLGADELPFAGKTAVVFDHYSPPSSIEAANIHNRMRKFTQKHGATLYDVGSGICHQLLPEGGHLTCGDTIVGTDSHSTTYGAFNAFGCGIEGTDIAGILATGRNWFKVPDTIRVELTGVLSPGVWAKDISLHMLGRYRAEGCNYKVVEYKGPGVSAMNIDDRMTLCNHAAELGAKAAILEADGKTFEWLKARGAGKPRPVTADPDADYAEKIEIDVSVLAPQIACRHLIDDVVPVAEVTEQSIDVALIGTCTNGRLDDIRQAAAILRGQTVAKGIRLLVAPASRQVYLAAEREGLFRDIVEAGGSVYAPNCGTCVSLTQKLISGDGEVIISNANRNFKGRLGNAESEIWIASSATVAASALTGKLTDPREVEGGTWRPV